MATKMISQGMQPDKLSVFSYTARCPANSSWIMEAPMIKNEPVFINYAFIE
jgi:hypothetical protein